MKLKQYKGIWVREDKRVDRDMARDCLKHYSIFNFDANSRVMDLGANIGGFAKMVMDSQAQSYVAWEPDPENFSVIQWNTNNDPRATLNQGVVSMSHDKFLTFHQNDSNQAACSGSISPKSKRKIQYEVKNTHFDIAFDTHKPTHLKMDIEGAEIEWLDENQGVFPDHIQEFALELHGKYGIYKFEEVWYNNIIKDFDIVKVAPNYGFVSENAHRWELPNLGIDIKGHMFGIDIFMRRK